jgi:hypothetical protein
MRCRKSTAYAGQSRSHEALLEGETPICRSELGSEGVCCDKQIMSVSIRPHHLLCMLTYLGKGYTPAFVDNYSAIVQRLNDGEPVELVDGPDDLCQPMLNEPGCQCRNESVRHRDRTATADIAQALGRQLESGKSFVLDRQVLSLLREAFAMGTIRKACEGCEWQILCSKIARNEFRGCHLAPPD